MGKNKPKVILPPLPPLLSRFYQPDSMDEQFPVHIETINALTIAIGKVYLGLRLIQKEVDSESALKIRLL